MRLAFRLVLGAPLVLAACTRFGAPDAATDQGRRIGDLWVVFFIAGLAVAGIVIGLIAWSVLRYRRAGDGRPATFRENLPVEILAVTIPVLLVTGLFVATFRAERVVTDVTKRPDLTVEITGFKWSWRIHYPESGVTVTGTPDERPTMGLPVGQTIRIELRSTDVIHSLWVPDFLFKRDAIPGRTTAFQITVDREGTFVSRCAEYCGIGHGTMLLTVESMSPDAFDRWLIERSAET